MAARVRTQDTIERQLIDDYLGELAALDRRFTGKSKLLDRYMDEAGDVRLELIDHPDLFRF